MRLVLLLAATIGAAAAVDPGYVFDGCGCGNAVQTFSTVSSAYCPTTSYPTCDLSQMVEGGCIISCPNPRSKLVYRNATAIWQTTKSISCSEGQLTNTAGARITNLMRPTCAVMNSCDNCTIAVEPSCPEGYTCQESNLHRYTDSDGCGRLACNAGTLKLYENGVVMNYTMINQKLYCTVLARWSNYSLEGSITGGSLLNNTITANCILPKSCENCLNPAVATSLAQLPTTFRTGFLLANATHAKEEGACSRLTCPEGFLLYGFLGNATNVTGLEYTNRGYLQCGPNAMWTNGGFAQTPINLLSACLRVDYPCTCNFNRYTGCDDDGCDSSLLNTAPLSEGSSCDLDCPPGYRLMMRTVSQGWWYAMENLRCTGTAWVGKYWTYDFDHAFSLGEAEPTCELGPFPIGFDWPINPMVCDWDLCRNDYLLYQDGVLKCKHHPLVVSSDRIEFVASRTLSNITWTGTTWNGYSLATGEPVVYPPGIFITCYPMPPEPVTTTTTSSPTTTTHPCSCNFNRYTGCDGDGCDSSLLNTAPLSEGSSCDLECPPGYRLMMRTVSQGWWYAMENLRCTGTAWVGKYWTYDFDHAFSLSEAEPTCELGPFPIGFDWPINPMVCDWDLCRNDYLLYDNGVLKCKHHPLVVSKDRIEFVDSRTLSNITWTGTTWNGYTLATGEPVEYPPEVFITCYPMPPEPVPSTTTAAAATTTTSTACGAYDEYPMTDEVEVVCLDGQNQLKTPGSYHLIEINTLESATRWERMAFVEGVGWFSFNYTGRVRLWTKQDEEAIEIITTHEIPF